MLVPGLLAALIASPAQAYVPPSFFVVRMLAHKHATLDEGQFKSRLTFYRRSGEPSITLNEILTIPDPEHAVVRITDSSGNEVARQTRRLLGDKTARLLDRPVTYDLLYIRDGSNIFEHLKMLGLPLKTETDLYTEKEGALPYKPETAVALERYEGRVAVVVGDRSKKSDANASLWVEKDSFLPMRAFFPSAPESGMASEPLELRLSGYTMYKAFLYPRIVQIYRNGALWAKIETVEGKAAANVPFEEAAAKVDAGGEVKDNVDAYLRWIR